MKTNSPTATTWWVEVFLGETDGHSHATAHLHTHDRTTLTASGTARLHPGERDVPEIGYELATGRALANLGAPADGGCGRRHHRRHRRTRLARRARVLQQRGLSASAMAR